MVLKIVAGMSGLILLIVAILLNKELAEARLEIEDLKTHSETVAEEAAEEQASHAAQANAEAELAALRETLSSMKAKLAHWQQQSTHEQKKVQQEAADSLEKLTAGFAKALSRFKFSQKELETLLEDLPAKDRHRLLDQITTLELSDSVAAEQARTTEVEVTPTTKVEAEKKDTSLSTPASGEEPKQLAPEDETKGVPAIRKPMKEDGPKIITYTVKRGDNLTRIGRKFDVTVTQIMKLNGIVDPNKLRIGQRLKIPRH